MLLWGNSIYFRSGIATSAKEDWGWWRYAGTSLFFVVYLSPDRILQWTCEVVCLQEVQFDTEENGSFSLPAWLKKLDGYTACLPGDKYLTQMAERNERVLANRVAIGCAVLFRSDRLVQREETARSDPNRVVSACLEGHPESGIRHLGRTAFFSVHLDAQSEEERVEQLQKCLEKARALGTRDAVFTGDMNAECFPGSCVRAIIPLRCHLQRKWRDNVQQHCVLLGQTMLRSKQRPKKAPRVLSQQHSNWNSGRCFGTKQPKRPKNIVCACEECLQAGYDFPIFSNFFCWWSFDVWTYLYHFVSESIWFSFGLLSVFESLDALDALDADLARAYALRLWPWDVRRALCDLEFGVLADRRHHPDPCDSIIPPDLNMVVNGG